MRQRDHGTIRVNLASLSCLPFGLEINSRMYASTQATKQDNKMINVCSVQLIKVDTAWCWPGLLVVLCMVRW